MTDLPAERLAEIRAQTHRIELAGDQMLLLLQLATLGTAAVSGARGTLAEAILIVESERLFQAVGNDRVRDMASLSLSLMMQLRGAKP